MTTLSLKKKKISKPKAKTPTYQTAEKQEFETYKNVAERFVKHQRISKGWNAETEKGYVAILDIVQEVFGNIPINAIDHEMAEELRDVILQLPPNRTRSAEWNKLSIKQILKKSLKRQYLPEQPIHILIESRQSLNGPKFVASLPSIRLSA